MQYFLLVSPVLNGSCTILAPCREVKSLQQIQQSGTRRRNLLVHSFVFTRGQFWAPSHDDVIKWKHFSRYWPFVRGYHQSPVNSPNKGQWRGTLMFPLICAWINVWATIVRLLIWDAMATIMTSLQCIVSSVCVHMCVCVRVVVNHDLFAR